MGIFIKHRIEWEKYIKPLTQETQFDASGSVSFEAVS